MIINIASDYSKIPGGRFIHDGPFSGEDFRETILLPKFYEAKKNHEELTVVLDGGYGYGTSFLDEAFGGLARKLKDADILKIRIITEEEPELESQIIEYIKKGLRAK